MLNSFLILLVFSVLFTTIAQTDKEEGEAFLAAKRNEKGIIALKSGILIKSLEEADLDTAKSPNKEDICHITYKGSLLNGTVFDSGDTALSPNLVFTGFWEVLELMAEGDKWNVWIPSEHAFGAIGRSPIPPYGVVVFEIEVNECKGGKTAKEARQKLKLSSHGSSGKSSEEL